MKRVLSLILALALTLGCTHFALADDVFELTFAYNVLSAGSLADLDQVVEKINEISVPEIGVKLKAVPIQVSAYDQQMTLMITSGEALDLVVGGFGSMLSNYVATEKILPLNKLLDEHGQGIKELLGDYLEATTFNGEVYAIPTIRDLCRGVGLNYDVALAEKYNIDMSQVKSLKDMEKVFEVIKAGEGENFPCLVISSSGKSFFTEYVLVDGLGDGNGVLTDFGLDDTNVTFWEATEEYKELMLMMEDWYKKGYIQQDVVTSQETKYTMLQQNLGFCYTTNCKPGITATATRSVGREIACIQFEDYFATTSQVANIDFAIPQSCANPEKTMDFLNLLYTDSRVATLLACGIEGKHYQVLDNGKITFPDGVDGKTSTYFPNVSWAVGNQFITPNWASDPDNLWDEQKAANDNAKKSLALGFTFDSSNVTAEITAISNVRNEYRTQIEWGACDVEEMLPKYIQALKDAGIETVIAEKQRQLDDWLASK